MRLGIHFLCPFFLFVSSVILGMAVSLVSYSSFSFFLPLFGCCRCFFLRAFAFSLTSKKTTTKNQSTATLIPPRMYLSLSLPPSLSHTLSPLSHTLSHSFPLSLSHALFCSLIGNKTSQRNFRARLSGFSQGRAKTQPKRACTIRTEEAAQGAPNARSCSYAPQPHTCFFCFVCARALQARACNFCLHLTRGCVCVCVRVIKGQESVLFVVGV